MLLIFAAVFLFGVFVGALCDVSPAATMTGEEFEREGIFADAINRRPRVMLTIRAADARVLEPWPV
jgi:hypothetical protein